MIDLIKQNFFKPNGLVFTLKTLNSLKTPLHLGLLAYIDSFGPNRIQNIYNLVENKPTHCICKKPLIFKGYANGYSSYCSLICSKANAKLDDEAKVINVAKRKDTMKSRYGHEYFKMNEEQREKHIVAMKIVAATITADKRLDMLAKQKTTNLERYGTVHLLQNEELRLKSSSTKQRKHHKEVIAKNITMYGQETKPYKVFKGRQPRKTIFEQYGVKRRILNPISNSYRQEIIAKRVKTINDNYGSLSERLREVFKKLGYNPRWTAQANIKRLITKRSQQDKLENTLNKLVKRGYQYHTSIENLISEFNSANNPFVQISHKCGAKYNSIILNSTGPIRCICEKMRSNEEQIIVELCEDFGLIVETNVRSIISPLEIDIWIPELKLAIEINGVYWHSLKQNEDHEVIAFSL